MIFLVSVIAGAGYGGIQTVNRLLLHAAQQAGVKGSVVSRYDPHQADWLSDWPDSFCAAGSVPQLLRGALQTAWHAKGQPTLTTHIGLAPVARVMKQITGGPLYIFLHGVEAWGPLPAITRWGARACNMFVANSYFTLDRFYRSHPEFAEIPGEVCYLPARLTPQEATPAARQLRVLLVGRLWGRGLRKGQKEIIGIWPRILEKFPEAEFWIIGDGDGRAELEALAQQHRVAHAVRCTGAISDEELRQLYRTSAVYAMPSWGEGFGLVFADAMAHGLPCIASRHDAGGEVVQDGITGLHVDPENPDELYAALCRLLSDAGLRARFGQAGQVRARQNFSLTSFQERAAQILFRRT